MLAIIITTIGLVYVEGTCVRIAIECMSSQ